MAITRRARAETVGNEEKRQKKGNEGNGHGSSSFSSEEAASEYEAMRARRMKENMERMELLGILNIQKKLKKTTNGSPEKKKKSPAPKFVTSNDPPRRSSRLQNMTRVCYSEMGQLKGERRVITNSDIHMEEGSNPELYTEEHEKLLGDSKTPWTLFIDGYDAEGQRIYDQFLGKSCHQCRQKTLGRRTKCSCCMSISGQFCGDCLYMRYGENIIEVNENLDWICPVCRGICNCNRCRRRNGWPPTGAIYKQVHNLGFKSVAHYLIRTHREQIKAEESAIDTVVVSTNDSSSTADTLPDYNGNNMNNEENDGQIASAESHL